jgi:NAD/NADP transhydrogenase beta subunit
LVTLAVPLFVISGSLFLAGLAGLHRRRSVATWSAVLAVAGAGLAAAGLLVQDQPGAASWFVGLPVGACLSLVHGRALFATGGPFRT